MQCPKRLKVFLITALGLINMCALGCVSFWRDADNEPLRALEAIRVPEGFTVEVAAGPELASYAMFASLDHRGRLFLSESSGPNTMTTEEMLEDPTYRIRMLEDTSGDGVYDRSTVFADNIPLPQGGVWYGDSFYVTAAPDLLRFEDTDDDGVADKREVVLTGWTLSVNAATLHGPFLGPDGWLYLTDARRGYEIETKEGTILDGKGPRIWRCRPDGTGLEWVAAGGFDNPVELIFTPAGELIGTMTYFVNPRAGERDALMHWVEGGVYPKPHSVIGEDRLKRTGELMPVMTKFARVAPSGLARYRSEVFGPEYRDNLFSVQFNTHRVLRHVVSRTGATFQTEDEEFLSSSDPDFHPTDVLEDADGSLLVIDTGGWFIKGCPVSRVSKPEFRGAIYRVRKKSAPSIEDPRGLSLQLENRSPDALVRYLEDPRPAVADRATELAVQAGEDSVGALENLLKDSPSAEARAAAVFALFRIGTPEALDAIRASLEDPDLQVRMAAARCAGMVRDRQAVERLKIIVQNDEPPVRRQAATALGQIRSRSAIPALLAAASSPDDRFVEHSIIHALISLESAQPLVQALSHREPKVRKAALIALDQMEGSPLRRQQLTPFLGVENDDLRQAALWVASHHPDWADAVVQFLRRRLSGARLSDREAAAVQDVLVSFCAKPSVQQLVFDLLQEERVSKERQVFLLETIDQCSISQIPENWIPGIGRLLEQQHDAGVRSRSLALIRSMRLSDLSSRVEQLADNPAEPPDLRAAALGALVISDPQLSDSQFEFLRSHLDPDVEAPLRLAVAEVIGHAGLTKIQLLTLAREVVPRADPLVLGQLLDAFRNHGDADVGEALVQGLLAVRSGLDSFELSGLQELLASYPDSVQSSAEPLVERLNELREARIERLEELEVGLTGGDASRGRSVFFGKEAACSSCHTIGSEGGEVGPDLTAVGATRSRHDILESILFPSASFVRGHESHRVRTKRDTFAGIMKGRTRDAVVLVTGADSKIRIPRDEIISMEPSAVSLMPEGLDESLTRQQMADLLMFLEAQRERPE